MNVQSMYKRSHGLLAYCLCVINLSLVKQTQPLTIVKCDGEDATLCGNLNKGHLPENPLGKTFDGSPYPFELIMNKTQEIFNYPQVSSSLNSHTKDDLKIVKDDREKRELHNIEEDKTRQEPVLPEESNVQGRDAGGWCDDSFGVFCMLFNAIKGGDSPVASSRLGSSSDPDTSVASLNSLDQPMTPCPSAVEYVTPVFAKNYQGVWRYVVQIPYEGYFTQTVEVVKCLSTKCEFLEGSCLASPRWVSLLVAEIYYPDTYFPGAEEPIVGREPIKASPPSDYNQYLLKRSGKSESDPQNCDGYDELGCYHVRLYYDWFLIPGSCKCWRNDFFSKHITA